MSKLSELSKKIKNRTIEAEYPDIEDFIVTFNYVSKEDLLKIREEAMTFTFNKKTREREDVVDSEKFTEMYIDSAIISWTGLKMKHLPELLVVDISESDPEEIIEYTQEEARFLATTSSDFDLFITEVMNDYEKFSILKKEKTIKNSDGSSDSSTKGE